MDVMRSARPAASVPAASGPAASGPAASPGGPTAAPPAASVHLLRTPVYDQDLRLTGYQLSLATEPGLETSEADLAAAVFDLLVRAPVSVLAGGGSAFLRLPRACLLASTPLPVPPAASLVLEVDEDLLSDRDVVAAVEMLAAAGHRLGLIGTVWSAVLRPLLPLFCVVRADIARVGSAGLATLAGRLSNQPISLLVEGVESFGQLESCRRAGVRLLSGTLVSRPAVVSDRAIEPSQLACLRLMTALVRSDIDLGEIELAVRSDPALTMRVLKLVNSAGGARQRVSSIRQAVVLLGPRALLGCVLSAGLSQGGTPTAVEAVEAVLVRARMCELLAGVVDGWGGEVVDGSAAFTVGMVASLDVLLGASPQDILGELPVDEAVENAVLFRGGPLGEVLADVLRYEGLEAPRLVDGGSLRSMHLAALGWAAPLTAPTSG